MTLSLHHPLSHSSSCSCSSSPEGFKSPSGPTAAVPGLALPKVLRLRMSLSPSQRDLPSFTAPKEHQRDPFLLFLAPPMQKTPTIPKDLRVEPPWDTHPMDRGEMGAPPVPAGSAPAALTAPGLIQPLTIPILAPHPRPGGFQAAGNSPHPNSLCPHSPWGLSFPHPWAQQFIGRSKIHTLLSCSSLLSGV